MQGGMEQGKPGFQTRVALERFEHVRDASFTSDGKGLWAPVTEASSSLWDAETGRIVFAPALPETAISPASATTDEAPAAGLAESKLLFRAEQARTLAETATALLDRNRSPSFKWSLKVSSRADPPKPQDWRAVMPYRFLFASDEKLLLIEQGKDYLPEGLLVDLETGEEIARVKAGQISTSGDAARLGAGVWFSESHPGSRPRALFITAESVRDAGAATGSEVTALLRSGEHGALFLGTSKGELLSCKRGSPAPVLTLRVAEGPVRTISRGTEGRLIIEAEGAVSFLLPDGSGADIQTYPGCVGDISADGTLTAAMTPDGLSIFESLTGTVAWSVGKPFDRILFSCDGSSVYCMRSEDRAQTLEEFDSLAGLPLDPPTDIKFKNLLARQEIKRFGGDEYITSSARPDAFRWISGAQNKAGQCFRGSPGRGFTDFSERWGSFCFPGNREKTYVRIDSNTTADLKPQFRMRSGDIKDLAVKGTREPGELDIVFGPDDALVLIASIDGVVLCHDTFSGELRWQLSRPFGMAAYDIRKVPSRSVSSVLFLDGHLNVLDRALQRLSTPEVLPKAVSCAELSAMDTEIACLRGHGNALTSAVFSPDGTRIVTASSDKTARIWDAASGAEIARLTGHGSSVTSAAFSPDGTRVVTASSDKTARIWDAASGAEIACLSGHQSSVTSAAFSPDGTQIVMASASWDKTAAIWDAASGAPIARLSGHQQRVASAAFSPDGTRIVTASEDNTVRIWDAATGAELAHWGGAFWRKSIASRKVTSAAFSPDGTRVAMAFADKTATIWDGTSGSQMNRGWHTRAVNSTRFSPDSRLVVTASSDKAARIWDAATGNEKFRLQGHEDEVNSAAFSPDGTRIVTASDDKTVRIWDTASGAEIACLTGHERGVKFAAFSPDGTRIVTASSDKTARIWDAALCSRILTLGLDGSVSLWSTRPGGRISEQRGTTKIRQARFSSCGRFFATADAEGVLRLCSSQGGDTLWQVRSGHRDIRAVSPLPGDDGIRILVGSHIETWRRGPDAGISAGHQRVSSVLSVNGWPLRFVTDLASLLDLDEKTLAGISSNGIAYDGMRSRMLHDGQKHPLTLHVPYGPLRAVHRKLRPGLEDLRAQELGRALLPVWRNAASALSAHAGAPVTVSLRIGAYAERLLFGRVLAWMKSGPLQMGDDAATLLSRILTRSDHLAIQTRTAALLGELMTIDLTTRLAALGRDQGVNVTRFSDRIFISGEDIPAGIGSFARTHRDDIFVPGRLLSQAVSRSGFRLEAYGEVRGRVSEPA